jgi:hypothetical protein
LTTILTQEDLYYTSSGDLQNLIFTDFLLKFKHKRNSRGFQNTHGFVHENLDFLIKKFKYSVKKFDQNIIKISLEELSLLLIYTFDYYRKFNKKKLSKISFFWQENGFFSLKNFFNTLSKNEILNSIKNEKKRLKNLISINIELIEKGLVCINLGENPFKTFFLLNNIAGQPWENKSDIQKLLNSIKNKPDINLGFSHKELIANLIYLNNLFYKKTEKLYTFFSDNLITDFNDIFQEIIDGISLKSKEITFFISSFKTNLLYELEKKFDVLFIFFKELLKLNQKNRPCNRIPLTLFINKLKYLVPELNIFAWQ